MCPCSAPAVCVADQGGPRVSAPALSTGVRKGLNETREGIWSWRKLIRGETGMTKSLRQHIFTQLDPFFPALLEGFMLLAFIARASSFQPLGNCLALIQSHTLKYVSARSCRCVRGESDSSRDWLRHFCLQSIIPSATDLSPQLDVLNPGC